MQTLFLFIYRYRALFIFILLEVLCGWFIVYNNQYQSAAFFNSANRFVGNWYDMNTNVTEYLALKRINVELAEENAELRLLLTQNEQTIQLLPKKLIPLPEVIEQYSYIPAKVIKNSTLRSNNFITLNKGSKDGIKPEMGVISSNGVIGKVKSVSEHFSTVLSLLNSDVYISSKLASNGVICSTNWDGKNPRYANLLFVPRHIELQKGDTVLSSEFNAIFPENVPIGIVEKVSLSPDAAFYDANILLFQDFHKIDFVYVVDNKLKLERDSLQNASFYRNE
jgi:rod shape-determining protein MreC